MVKIKQDFTKVKTTKSPGICQKPGCFSRRIYRHHRGDEHRYVRTFIYAGNRARWTTAIINRYHQFHQDDIVYVCGDHHEEVHYLLWEALCQWVDEQKLYKPLTEWSKEQVISAIDFSRRVTDNWLLVKTPGTQRRILTTYP